MNPLQPLRHRLIAPVMGLMLLAVSGVAQADDLITNPGDPMTLAETLQLRVEETDHLPIDLEVIVQRIQNDNLDVAVAQTQIDKAQGARISSFAGLMPTVRAQGFVERFTGSDIFVQQTPISVNRTTYRPRVSLDYQLPLGGKPLFQIQIAKHQWQASQHASQAVLQDTLRQALDDYFVWLADQGRQQVAEQALDEAQAYVRYNQSRQQTGFGTQFEVEQAKVQQAERQNAVFETRNQAAESAINLMSRLNLPITAKIKARQPVNAVVPFLDAQATDLPTLMAQAEANRPDVQELTSQIKAARAYYRATFSDLLPTVGITSYVGGVGPQTNDLRQVFQRGVFINLDLLRNMGLDTMGNLKAHKARVQEAILGREKKLREIQDSLARAYFAWQKVNVQLPVAQQKRQAASEALRIAQARQQTGFGTQFEVLSNQTKMTEATHDLQNLMMKANIAQVALLYETGQLTPLRVLAVAHALPKPLPNTMPDAATPIAPAAANATPAPDVPVGRISPSAAQAVADEIPTKPAEAIPPIEVIRPLETAEVPPPEVDDIPSRPMTSVESLMAGLEALPTDEEAKP
jgi:outer membrane protein TolC